MIFMQWSAQRSCSTVQQASNFNQRRKGNFRGRNSSNRDHVYKYRQNIIKTRQTGFTCRRYTKKFQVWENQPYARYYGTIGVRPCVTAKLPVLRPMVLELHLAQILRPLLATLLPPLLAEFAASIIHWKMQNLKWPVCPTPAGCLRSICSAGHINRFVPHLPGEGC